MTCRLIGGKDLAMKNAKSAALLFLIGLTACSDAMAEALQVRCTGIQTYTGMMGTELEFISSDLFEATYEFDENNKKIYIHMPASKELNLPNQRHPWCLNGCNTVFRAESIISIRQEDVKNNRMYQAAFFFDRRNFTLKMVRGSEGSSQVTDASCKEVVIRDYQDFPSSGGENW